MTKRKNAAYITYDYEEAYQQQLDRIAEEQALRLLQSGRQKTVYATKEIRAGEQLEIEIYPEFTRKERQLIPSEAMRKKQRQAQRNLNEKNSRKQCERVINENFGDRDIWATFTYTDADMPSSMEEAERDMKNYIRRLNYHRKKQGLPNARYVYVTECESAESGRFHHHIVMDGDIDMDTVESLWMKGRRNNVRRLDKDENGLVGMAKYITKEKKKKGEKKWTPSKGLRKPKESVNHYKFKRKDVDEIVRNRDCIEDKLKKWYAKDGYIFTSAEVRYNEVNNRFYVYARMRKNERSGTVWNRNRKDYQRRRGKRGGGSDSSTM